VQKAEASRNSPHQEPSPRMTWVVGPDALKMGDERAEKQQELDGDVEMKEDEVRSSFSSLSSSC